MTLNFPVTQPSSGHFTPVALYIYCCEVAVSALTTRCRWSHFTTLALYCCEVAVSVLTDRCRYRSTTRRSPRLPALRHASLPVSHARWCLSATSQAVSRSLPTTGRHIDWIGAASPRGAPKWRARPPPLGPEKTLYFQGFLPLNYVIYIFEVCFFMLFAMWEDWGSLQHGK